MWQGRWLRDRWERFGFSIAQLSRATGVSRRTLERIGRGTGSRPSLATVHALAGPLRLTLLAVALLTASTDVDPAVIDAVLAQGSDGELAGLRDRLEHVEASVEVLTSEVERIRRVVWPGGAA